MSDRITVKFGDMAYQISTKIKPKDTSLTTYVGLEHLNSGSLHITRHGTPEDVVGEKLKVCTGDIIFGKRRVYQRKVAIADFDGICSAHAMVLRPKEDTVDKGFFPFFMQSDLFMERALQISVGSLSPTINWKTLAGQEFCIPTLQEQHRIATTLWAAEHCIVKGERFLVAAERAKQVLMRELFSKGIRHREFKDVKGFGKLPIDWMPVIVKDVISKSQYGISVVGNSEGEYPLLRMNNLVNGKLDTSDLQYVNICPELLENFKLNKGDILFNRTNSLDLVGKTSIFDLDEIFVFASYLIRIIPDLDVIVPEYLNYYLNWENSQKKLKSLCSKGVSQCNINAQTLSCFPIPLPPLPEQRQIANILTQCDGMIASVCTNVAVTKALKMKMINEWLGTGE